MENLNYESIIIIDEGEYEVSKTKDLYTTEIYSCVALYAVSENFSFLAHILTEDTDNEFSVVGVDKINKLYDYIIDNHNEDSKIFVGLVYGVWKDPSLEDKYEVIEEELEEKLSFLEEEGIHIERFEDIESEYVYINTENKEITFENDYYDLSESKKSTKVHK